MPRETRDVFFQAAVEMILFGRNRGKRELAVLTEDDGTLRTWAPSVLRIASGQEIISLAEDDGTLRSQLILWTGAVQARALSEADGTQRQQLVLWTGAAQARALSETDGTLKASLLGKDSGGALASPRVNAADQNQLVQQPLEHWIQVDPVLIPGASGILWNPGASASELYLVEFYLVNTSAAGVAVTLGQDIAGGGTLAVVEQWIPGVTIAANTISGPHGPFELPGDDDVRGSAGTADVVNVQWRVRRVK